MHMLTSSSDVFRSVSLSQISYPFVVFPVYFALSNHLVISMIPAFRCAVNDIVVLLGFYTV